MNDPQESELGRQFTPDPSRSGRRVRAAESDESTMRRSIQNANPNVIGFAYSAPEHGPDPEPPVTRLGLAWRITASLVLAAIGVNAIVQIIRLLAATDPNWVGALGMTVVAMLTLAYPAVNIARWLRTRRRQRPRT